MSPKKKANPRPNKRALYNGDKSDIKVQIMT
jgi:hypothetical protein